MEDEREPYAEQLLQLVSNDVHVFSTHAVTLLILGTFIAITIASTTHEMLMRAAHVTLPLLNVQVPIRGTAGSFYFIAPLMILAMHCDVLLQLSLLAYRLTLFQEQITPLPDQQRNRLCTRLPSFYTIQFLEGSSHQQSLTWISSAVMSLTIVPPLGLLLWLQIRFLPVHDLWATSFHMGIVMADAALIIWLWPHLPGHRHRPGAGSVWWRRAFHMLGRVLVPGICLSILLLSILPCWVIMTIPAQKQQSAADAWGLPTKLYTVRDLNLRQAILTVPPVPPEGINALIHGPFERREEVLNTISPVNFLQGRDLRLANLESAVLPRLDLRANRIDGQVIITQLQGADLRFAQMQRVLLDEANLRGADLTGAGLQDGNLLHVDLQGAVLKGAGLQVAQLRRAKLQCTQASEAKLHGANLSEAQLQGADFSNADLRGAILRGANLQWANLSQALLQGADLSGTNLQCANLKQAQLQGAVLDHTSSDELPEEGQSIAFDKTYCSKEQLATFKKCEASPPSPASWPEQRTPAEDSTQWRTKYLVGLACSDVYIAHGLSQQVHGPQRRADYCLLAKVLRDCQCRNVQLLHERVRKELAHVISSPACTALDANVSSLAFSILESSPCLSSEGR